MNGKAAPKHALIICPSCSRSRERYARGVCRTCYVRTLYATSETYRAKRKEGYKRWAQKNKKRRTEYMRAFRKRAKEKIVVSAA